MGSVPAALHGNDRLRELRLDIDAVTRVNDETDLIDLSVATALPALVRALRSAPSLRALRVGVQHRRANIHVVRQLRVLVAAIREALVVAGAPRTATGALVVEVLLDRVWP